MHITRRTKRWQLGAVGVVGMVVLAGACSSGGLSDNGGNGGQPTFDAAGGTCAPGRQGCSCDSPGETILCGHMVNQFGDYVTCSQGAATCQNGAWSACEGSVTFIKSLGSSSIGSGGIRILSNPVACTDPCDPNTCMQTGEGPGDVDAAGILPTEAGVTINPTVTQGGGGGDGGACMGLQCQVDWTCPKGSQTTLTGTVYDPAGNNPLYDAFVYIPVDPNPANLPAFTSGVSCDTCAGAGNLNAVAVAETDAHGKFTLPNVPTTAKAPNSQIPLVVQMGKWRRVQMLNLVPDCTTTAIPPANSRLPRNQTDGYGGHADMPQIAFVSGSADPFECMLLKAGIDPNEFGSSSLNSNKRIHYYNSPDSAGSSIDPSLGNVVKGDAMWNNGNAPWNLSAYDVVILACEGNEFNNADRSTSGYANLIDYAANGGRVFLTHYSYVWMKYNAPWQAIPASWGGTGTVNTQDPLNTSILTTFAKGQSMSTWLGNAPNPNGLTGPGATLPIHQGRQDFMPPLAAGVQPWMTVSNTSLSGSIDGVCSCYQDSDCSQGTCTAGALGGCSNNAATTCVKNSDCGNGHTCNNPAPKAGTCSVATCTAAGNCTQNKCTPIPYSPTFTFNTPLNQANQCGRAVFTDFHVATSAQVTSSSCTTSADCGYGAVCGGMNGIPGTCLPQPCDANNAVATCGDPNFTCPGGTVGNCGCYETSECAAMNAGTCSGQTTGNCSKKTCYQASECSAAGTGACTGALGKCGCYETSDCATMGAGTCSGQAPGNCGTKTCYQNSDCAAAGTGACTGGVLGSCTMQAGKSCTLLTQNADCRSHVCNVLTGKCTSPGVGNCDPNQAGTCGAKEACTTATAGKCGCYETSDCTTLGAGNCAGNTAGKCSAATCEANSGCTAGNTTCTGATKGACGCYETSDCATLGANTCSGFAAGTCSSATCYQNSDCSAATKKCNGSPADGTCQANACTTNAQCAGTEQCVGGTCNGCFADSDCPGSTSSCVGAVAPGTCGGNQNNFPYECSQGLLDPQEAALEFLFFDLAACVTPDNNPPPGPPAPVVNYYPVTFTEDFQSTCPSGTHVVWREIDWQATIPNTASIVFSAQTADPAADGGPPNYSGVQSVKLATATTTTANLPMGWDAALIDVAGTGAFNSAMPAVESATDLRLTITLNSTTDNTGTPTLIQWQVKSDCPPTE